MIICQKCGSATKSTDTPNEQLMCPRCYKNHRAWSMHARCPFCGTTGRAASEVAGPEWKKKLHDIDYERPTRAKPAPVKPSDRVPYSPGELRLVILRKMPFTDGRGRCDWCGGPWITREHGPRMCNRCWLNREQIRKEIERLTPNEPMQWNERINGALSALSAEHDHSGS